MIRSDSGLILFIFILRFCNHSVNVEEIDRSPYAVEG